MKRALLLLPLVGCVDFQKISGPVAVTPGFVGVHVQTELRQPAEGPDSLLVFSELVARTSSARFVDDTLRVGGAALAPKLNRRDVDRAYDTLLVFPAAPAAVAVRLPEVAGAPFVPAAFQLPLVVRDGPARITLPRGADLVLSVSPGALPAGIDSVEFQGWTLSLRGGVGNYFASGQGGLPSRVVVPASSVPRDTTSRGIIAQMTTTRGFRRHTRGDSTRVVLTTSSVVRWRVLVEP